MYYLLKVIGVWALSSMMIATSAHHADLNEDDAFFETQLTKTNMLPVQNSFEPSSKFPHPSWDVASSSRDITPEIYKLWEANGGRFPDWMYRFCRNSDDVKQLDEISKSYAQAKNLKSSQTLSRTRLQDARGSVVDLSRYILQDLWVPKDKLSRKSLQDVSGPTGELDRNMLKDTRGPSGEFGRKMLQDDKSPTDLLSRKMLQDARGSIDELSRKMLQDDRGPTDELSRKILQDARVSTNEWSRKMLQDIKGNTDETIRKSLQDIRNPTVDFFQSGPRTKPNEDDGVTTIEDFCRSYLGSKSADINSDKVQGSKSVSTNNVKVPDTNEIVTMYKIWKHYNGNFPIRFYNLCRDAKSRKIIENLDNLFRNGSDYIGHDDTGPVLNDHHNFPINKTELTFDKYGNDIASQNQKIVFNNIFDIKRPKEFVDNITKENNAIAEAIPLDVLDFHNPPPVKTTTIPYEFKKIKDFLTVVKQITDMGFTLEEMEQLSRNNYDKEIYSTIDERENIHNEIDLFDRLRDAGRSNNVDVSHRLGKLKSLVSSDIGPKTKSMLQSVFDHVKRINEEKLYKYTDRFTNYKAEY